MARTAKRIFATKGKKLLQLDLEKDKPTDEQLAELIIGPSGNLRAPTLRVGDTLLVGFEDTLYREQLGV